MTNKPPPTLLTLPLELQTQIFSFVYPTWHLNDFTSKHRPPQTGQRRYLPKLSIFELPGRPAPQAPRNLRPLLICKSLHPIARKAYHDSFTHHAHISCNRTIWSPPTPWLRLLSHITSLSIDLSWCDAPFTEDLSLRMSSLRRVKLYCYRDYCWRPRLQGITTDCVPAMLGTTKYDELFRDETSKSIVDNDGLGYLRGFPGGLEELMWCQCFEFGEEFEGVLIVEYEVPGIEDLKPDFHENWELQRKRYVLFDC